MGVYSNAVADLQNAWQIVAAKKTYTLFASSPKEKQEWMKDMNQVVEQLVALDPSLVNKRSTQIQTTKRITRYAPIVKTPGVTIDLPLTFFVKVSFGRCLPSRLKNYKHR